MSAAERKTASADLSNDIKAQKEALATVNADIKAAQKLLKEDVKKAEADIKAMVKDRDTIAKGLIGLNIRKDALKAPKPILTQ
ncbi:MAG: hypothetical protein M3Q39_01680 [Actinomycetota bacterium]|nr:hypothetical protein [Actinomycetota bacterium]